MSLVIASAGCEKKAPPDVHVEQGFALLRGNPEGALKEFEQARDTGAPRTLLGRALALESLRRYGEAEAVLEKARAKSDELAVLLVLARVQLMAGKLDAARRSIDVVVAKEGSDLSALLLEACLGHDEARARRALAHLDAWKPKAEPPPAKPPLVPAEVHLARASLLAQLEQSSEQRKALAEAKRSWVSSPDEALSLAVLAAAAGRTDLAAPLLEKALPDTKSREQQRQIAELAHRLGLHELTRRALDSLPGDDASLLRLRARHDAATLAPSAVVSLRRALGVTKEPDARVELRLALAEALLRTGQVDEARKETEALLAENASTPGAALLLARIDLASGQPDAALSRVKPLLEGNAPSGARELAVLAHVAAGRPQEARPLVLALLEKEPQHHMAAKLLIAIERDAGRTKELVTTFAELVRRAPSDLTLRLLWIGLMRKVEPPTRIEQALRESVEQLPDQPRLWMELSRHHSERREDEAALGVLQEARRQNPRDPLIAAALAASLTRRGRQSEAAPLYNVVLEHAEGDVVALNNLAMFHVDELGDAQLGVKLAEKAHKLAPGEPAITDTLGWALYRRGTPQDLERAKELLEAIAGKLSSPTSRYHWGATLIAVGKTEEGRKVLREALASPQEFPEAEHARAMLGQGS